MKIKFNLKSTFIIENTREKKIIKKTNEIRKLFATYICIFFYTLRNLCNLAIKKYTIPNFCNKNHFYHYH